MIKRTAITIYSNIRSDTTSYIEMLGGTIQYVNKKAGYLIVYLDKMKLDYFIKKIKAMNGFKFYELSSQELVELDI